MLKAPSYVLLLVPACPHCPVVLPRPAALVLAFPAIVLSTSDRAFGYLTLFRSMVGVMTWLGLCAALGILNGLARAYWLLRRA